MVAYLRPILTILSLLGIPQNKPSLGKPIFAFHSCSQVAFERMLKGMIEENMAGAEHSIINFLCIIGIYIFSDLPRVKADLKID